MGLSRLAKECKNCPFVEKCDHKRMESLAYLPEPMVAHAIGYDLETILKMNVNKLQARYPDGFDAEHSLHRAEDDI